MLSVNAKQALTCIAFVQARHEGYRGYHHSSQGQQRECGSHGFGSIFASSIFNSATQHATVFVSRRPASVNLTSNCFDRSQADCSTIHKVSIHVLPLVFITTAQTFIAPPPGLSPHAQRLSRLGSILWKNRAIIEPQAPRRHYRPTACL